MNLSKCKNIIFFFLYDINNGIMESTTTNNDINAIKEVRELFNEHRSNLIREERNRIKRKTL